MAALSRGTEGFKLEAQPLEELLHLLSFTSWEADEMAYAIVAHTSNIRNVELHIPFEELEKFTGSLHFNNYV